MKEYNADIVVIAGGPAGLLLHSQLQNMEPK